MRLGQGLPRAGRWLAVAALCAGQWTPPPHAHAQPEPEIGEAVPPAAGAEERPPVEDSPPRTPENPAGEPDVTDAAPASEAAPADHHSADDARDAAMFGGAEDTGADARDAAMFGGQGASDDGARDDAMFGGALSETASDRSEPASRDDAILGDPGGGIQLAEDVAPEDPLTLGGLVYLRLQSFILQDQPAEDWSISVPVLTQLYFDVRPNDRVRGFMQLRLQFDPTLPPSSQLTFGGPIAPGGATNGVTTLSGSFQSGTRAPQFTIDQLWLNFDIKHRVYLTAGKQHVRWGTGRFWMPTDYLHLQNRNPINVFDSRAGTSMVKLHIPVESLAWNFYGFALVEDPVGATNTWSKVAGALRAEFVLGTAELGLGLFARRGGSARGAADLSFGIWDLDFYSEVALRDAGDVDRVRYAPNAVIPPPMQPPSWQDPTEVANAELTRVVDARYPVYRHSGVRAQAVGGVTYSLRYDDDDVLTLGSEYFYNGLGYQSSDPYLGLVLPHTTPLVNPATFFYLGKHYLAIFATMPSPFRLDLHSFTFSTLGNLSDRTFISRIDYAYTLLTHLRLEAFAAVHYGQTTGEFRFGIESFDVRGQTISQPPSLIDLGLALRLEY